MSPTEIPLRKSSEKASIVLNSTLHLKDLSLCDGDPRLFGLQPQAAIDLLQGGFQIAGAPMKAKICASADLFSKSRRIRSSFVSAANCEWSMFISSASV